MSLENGTDDPWPATVGDHHILNPGPSPAASWANKSTEEILADMNALADQIVRAEAKRLTWRAIPELPVTSGGEPGWREAWWGYVGEARHFRIVPRPLLGGVRQPGINGSEGCTWDLFMLEPWFPAQYVGNFVELAGAQARARRIWRNNSCLPSGDVCECGVEPGHPGKGPWPQVP